MHRSLGRHHLLSRRQYIAVVTGGGKVTIDFLIGNDPKLQYIKNVPLGGTLTVFGLFE